ncbi:ccr4 associated factor [Boothiomyces sp. JEL0866]|nr:ccr4 associated factor [Boothiomyces sp. JEL0866]
MHSDVYPGLFTAFLNPKGRILMDAFIYKTNNDYIVEVDSSAVDSLMMHLQKYILRSKVKLNPLNFNVYQSWKQPADSSSIILPDPRNHQMGYRVLAKTELDHSENNESYLLKRICLGIPEGPDDLVENVSLPLEKKDVIWDKVSLANIELTIRTHHTGVIRKRLLPVQVCQAGDEVTKEITYIPGKNRFKSREDIFLADKPKGVGRTGSCLGNVGLGLVKLEHCDTQFRLHLANGDRVIPQMLDLETRLNKQIISLEQHIENNELELKSRLTEVTNLQANNKILFQQNQELTKELQEIKSNENGEIANLRKLVQDKERIITKLKDEKLDIQIPKFQLEKIYLREEPKIIYKTETITVKEKDPEYEAALQKVADYQHLTRKLETEISNLKSENSFLKSMQTNSAKLIEENNSLTFKLQLMEKLANDLEEAKLAFSRLEAEKKEWQGILQEHNFSFTSPFGLVQLLAKKQKEVLLLNDQLISKKYETARLEEQLQGKAAEISEIIARNDNMQVLLEKSAESMRRLQISLKIKDQEIKFLKDSFGSEINLSNEDLIVSYKKQIAEYEQTLLQKQEEINRFTIERNKFVHTNAEYQELKDLLCSQRKTEEDYKLQLNLINQNLESCKKQYEQAKLKYTEQEKDISKLNEELDHYHERLGKGDFNADNIKVLTLKNSPENLLRMNYVTTIESLRLENQELRSNSNVNSSISSNTVNSFNLQIEQYQEELQNRETKIKRLKQEFGRKVQEYKKYVYFMLGYKIEFPEDGSCRLYSIYGAGSDPHFKLVPNENDQNGGELLILGGSAEMQNYTEGLKEYYIDEYNSIPAFLNSFTVYLFNKINNIED